uniref:Uncharacterized protein n=2 Tax=Bracon brevicornis TaxID=1563983 RepID=A0A6V7JTI5_9HYME
MKNINGECGDEGLNDNFSKEFEMARPVHCDQYTNTMKIASPDVERAQEEDDSNSDLSCSLEPLMCNENLLLTGSSNNTSDICEQISDDKNVDQLPSAPAGDSMEQKLRAWASRNLPTLSLSVITDLLATIRSEGYSSLPQTAQGLLKTVHKQDIDMLVKKIVK